MNILKLMQTWNEMNDTRTKVPLHYHTLHSVKRKQKKALSSGWSHQFELVWLESPASPVTPAVLCLQVVIHLLRLYVVCGLPHKWMDQDFISVGLMTVMPVASAHCSLRMAAVVFVLGSEELLLPNKNELCFHVAQTIICQQIDMHVSTLFKVFFNFKGYVFWWDLYKMTLQMYV